MESLDAALAWLTTLPPGALLALMAVLAAVENIFPPIPADILVAFGSFLAARSAEPAWPAFLAVWGGNLLGAWLMYLMGRRFGAERVERRYHLDRTGGADARILGWHRKYGTAAFFLTRFIPGLRAVVPPVAGALRIPPLGVISAMGLASGIWYGAITWLAFRAGTNWDSLRGGIARLGSWSAGLAGAAVVVVAAVWWYHRRLHARPTRPPA
ncbi:MAG: DedA family protein [Gemmatimonadetes bacterium]|nr:DedA family protein [Gemmatimonadota bacterium]